MKYLILGFGKPDPIPVAQPPPKKRRLWLPQALGMVGAAFLLIAAGFGIISTTRADSLSAEERYTLCLNKVEAMFPARPYSANQYPAIALLGYKLSSYQTGLTDFDAVTLKELGKVTCTIEYHEVIGGGTQALRDLITKYETTAWTSKPVPFVNRVLLDGKTVVGAPETVVIGSERHIALAAIGALPKSLDEFVRFVDGMAQAYSCYPAEQLDKAGNPVYPAECATADQQLPRPVSLPLPGS